jgi:acyl-CoA synthetase (AMP-forming)/AMP-acid ligase II/acyl carrier protein
VTYWEVATVSVATLPERLLSHARDRGDQVAFHVLTDDGDTSLTWERLAAAAAAYAGLFRDAGVGPGSVVVICLRHGPSLYPAYLGAMLAGAVPSFVPFPTVKQDPALYWEAHRVLFGRVEAAVVLTYQDNAAAVADVLPPATRLLVDDPAPLLAADVPSPAIAGFVPPDLDAVALLQHSSGTTGHKKGVMLTHRQIALQVEAYAGALDLGAEDRIASWLPLYHDMGLVTALLAPLSLGATVVSLDAFAWADDPHSLLRAIDAYDCQFSWLPTFAFNHLVRTKVGQETYRLHDVRAFVSCSEPVKAETFTSFVETFAPHGVRPEQLQVSYAMAETVFAVTQTPLGRPPRTTVVNGVTQVSNGPPLEDIELRVAPAQTGAVGELEVRGPWVSNGYHRNPDATSESFVDGWYRTGDLGCVIDGEVYVLGRRKDVIIHHGVNYYAHDLEAAAATVPGVRAGRCAAVAVFDPAAGSERIEIIAERDDESGVADDQVVSAVKRAVSDRFNLAVDTVHVVEPGWLVKTTSGKVSRSENVAKLGASAPARRATGLGDAEDLTSQVLGTIATTFDVPVSSLGPETAALDVPGWDSLGHTVLMIRLGRALGRSVPESVAARARNVAELVEMLAEQVETR